MDIGSFGIRLHWLDTAAATECDVDRALCLLDRQERGIADRRQGGRRDYVLAHALLRVMLSRRQVAIGGSGKRPCDWCFRAGPYGKPELDGVVGSGRVPVSLSHADGLVAAVVGGTWPLGVDVEALQRSGLTMALAQRYFRQAEQNQILSASGPVMRQRSLLEVWTAKEAYAKATGLGLARTLDAAEVWLRPMRLGLDRSDGQQARLHLFRPSPRHQGALVVLGPAAFPPTIEASPVSVDRLLEEGLSLGS